MRIALCDADTTAAKITKRFIYEYANLHGIELLVEEYTSGNNLLINKIKYQLVILDYNTSDLNGLETARIIKSSNPTCTIVFLSSYKGFIIESFKVNPFRFLLKLHFIGLILFV